MSTPHRWAVPPGRGDRPFLQIRSSTDRTTHRRGMGGDGFMATPGESNTAGKDPRGFSGLDESQLEKAIIRRGLATPAEIEACKTKRTQMAAKDNEVSKSLL